MLLVLIFISDILAQTEDPITLPVKPVFQVKNSWIGGFSGELNIPVDVSKDSWTIEFRVYNISSVIENFNVYTAKVLAQKVSEEWMEYVLGPMEWNAKVKAGDNLKIDYSFGLKGQGVDNLKAKVRFNGKTIWRQGVIEKPLRTHAFTAPPPTEQPPESSESANKPTVSKTDSKYIEALEKSYKFFLAQRSGELPDSKIPWRGDTFLNDRGINNVSLAGGYFDAGDTLKLTFPLAYSLTMLSWNMLEFWTVYEDNDLVEPYLEIIKWGTDWLLRANPRTNVLYAQVGSSKEHDLWDSPERIKIKRPAYKITADRKGTDLSASVSACFAAAALVFEKSEGTTFPTENYQPSTRYIKELLLRSKRLYNFSLMKPYQYYHNSLAEKKLFYKSTSYKDDLVWAATWLFRATGNYSYYIDAIKKFHLYGFRSVVPSKRLSWDDLTLAVQTLLGSVGNSAFDSGTQGEIQFSQIYYLKHVNEYCSKVQRSVKGDSQFVQTTGKRLIFVDKWGPLKYALGASFICTLTDKLSNENKYEELSKSQVDYVLNPDFSYQIGFGSKYPLKPHHRGSSCKKTAQCDINSGDPNPNVLIGAVVGGPDENDNYKDSRDNYESGEPALDINSIFNAAVAGVYYRKLDRNDSTYMNVQPKDLDTLKSLFFSESANSSYFQPTLSGILICLTLFF